MLFVAPRGSDFKFDKLITKYVDRLSNIKLFTVFKKRK